MVWGRSVWGNHRIRRSRYIDGEGSRLTVPSSFPELWFFVALVIPGVTYAWAKRRFVGWQAPNQDIGTRTLEALFASVVFLLVYGAAFFLISGAAFTDAGAQLEQLVAQWPGALTWVVAAALLVGLPVLSAYLMNARWVKVPMDGGKTKRKQVNRVKDTPRGWDKAAFTAYTPRFVRVRIADGSWYGGWFDSDSLVSTYPHERDLFVQVQWQMSPEGDFVEPIPGSLGVWIPVTSDCIVEWVSGVPAGGEEEER